MCYKKLNGSLRLNPDPIGTASNSTRKPRRLVSGFRVQKQALISFNLFLLLIILFASTAFAALQAFSASEISMQTPLKVNVSHFTDCFPEHGCCYLHSKAIAVMVMDNKSVDLASMQDSMVKLSGVQLKDWAPLGKVKSTWKLRQDYQTICGNQAVMTIMGQGVKNSYLIMLCTDKNDFTAQPADYTTWRKSVSIASSDQSKLPK